MTATRTGTVYLVGAGPGDPGLLTVRARDLLLSARVVVHDALVHPDVLSICEEARRIFVGKRGGQTSTPQSDIAAILVREARAGNDVVRLKGGDPFVFGRGGEEGQVLREAGIPFEVVPGVTAGVAAPAYAGIPVTHRGVASSVTFATGHEDPSKSATDLDWTGLARTGGTLVFYMGVGEMERNFRLLVEGGRAPSTPAAAVEWGTYARQRTLRGTLETLPAEARKADLRAPAIVVVGEVVSLRDELSWFEDRPLSGQCIVVTRARSQASGMAAELTRLGAEVIQFPTIRIEDPEEMAPLEEAVGRLSDFEWIILTSTNGVDRFWRTLRNHGLDARALGGIGICAIGPATASALEARGVHPDIVPDEYVAERVVEALEKSGGMDGARILLPRAAEARAILPDSLRALGAEVHEVAAYRTVLEAENGEALRERLRDGTIDLITFTASSTARNFVRLAGVEIGEARVAAIGPITAETARELGLPVHIEAREYTVPGLIEAILRDRAAG